MQDRREGEQHKLHEGGGGGMCDCRLGRRGRSSKSFLLELKDRLRDTITISLASSFAFQTQFPLMRLQPCHVYKFLNMAPQISIYEMEDRFYALACTPEYSD